jgi:uncharacterized small protein (DUF1192 family)
MIDYPRAYEEKLGQCIGTERVDTNPTIEENIDTKINMLKKEIERLEDSKKTLAPLLAMKIRDIRDAMNY